MSEPTLSIERRGVMLALSSPSGAGKTTLAKRLLAAEREMALSVSATTRPMRDGEVEGVDYFFLERAEFERRIEAGAFLEHAHVHGNLYGTPREPVETWLADGRDVLFDIDWQGAAQLRANARTDLASVFVLPPSFAALEKRLVGRGLDAPEVIARRLKNAAGEIAHWSDYDYVIVNEDIDVAEAELKAVLTAERLKSARRVGLGGFVAPMLEKGEGA